MQGTSLTSSLSHSVPTEITYDVDLSQKPILTIHASNKKKNKKIRKFVKLPDTDHHRKKKKKRKGRGGRAFLFCLCKYTTIQDRAKDKMNSKYDQGYFE